MTSRRKKSESESSCDDCVFIIPIIDKVEGNDEDEEGPHHQLPSNEPESEDFDQSSESYFEASGGQTKNENEALRVLVFSLAILAFVYSIIVVTAICDKGTVTIEIYYNIAVTVFMWIGTGTAAGLILVWKNSPPSRCVIGCFILWKIVERILIWSVFIIIFSKFQSLTTAAVGVVVNLFVVAIYEVLDTILLLCVLFGTFGRGRVEGVE